MWKSLLDFLSLDVDGFKLMSSRSGRILLSVQSVIWKLTTMYSKKWILNVSFNRYFWGVSISSHTVHGGALFWRHRNSMKFHSLQGLIT